VVYVLTMLALLLAPTVIFSQVGGTVEGRVTDRTTGAGIEKAIVSLFDAKGLVQETVTDSSGRYQMALVRPGQCTIRFEKDGMFPSRWGTGFLKVTGNGSVHVDMEMVKAASLRGRVLDPSGRPAAQVQVHALLAAGTGPMWETETGVDGRFEFSPLIPGFYSFGAVPGSQILVVNGIRTQLAATSFHGGSEGRFLLLKSGDALSADIRLRAVPVHRVKGVVLNEDGRPRAGVSVIRQKRPVLLAPSFENMAGAGGYDSGWRPQRVEETVTTAPDGHFEFSSVPDGQWVFRAAVEQEDDDPLIGVTSLAVVKDVKDLEIRLASALSVNIFLDWQGKTDVADIFRSASVCLVALDGQTDNDRCRDTSGEISGVYPGRYILRAMPTNVPGFYPAAANLAGRNVLGEEFKLETAATPAVQMVYRAGTAVIRGIVEHGKEAIVALYPQDYKGARVLRFTRSGQDDTFELRNVAPGDYGAFAFHEMLPKTVMETPEFLKEVLPNAVRVRVEMGSTVNVRLRVTPLPE